MTNKDNLFSVWDTFTFVDILFAWLAIPIFIIFIILGMLYWFFIRPFRMWRKSEKLVPLEFKDDLARDEMKEEEESI